MKKNAAFIPLYLAILLITSVYSRPIYAQETPAKENSAVPNQVIVQFKDGYAPYKLESEVKQLSLEKGLFHMISHIFENIIDKPSPHDTLMYIMKSEKSAGVIEKSRMFDAGEESQSNTYLYSIDGSQSVEQAIDIFEKVPYVKYAQPNYLYPIQETHIGL